MNSNTTSQSYSFNLTYSTPGEDLAKSSGFNSNDSPYVESTSHLLKPKYSLISLKNLLLRNIEMIDMMIEESPNIKSMQSYDYGLDIFVEFIDPKTDGVKALLDSSIISIPVDTDNEDPLWNPNGSDSDEEIQTNEMRLNQVLNLTSYDDLPLVTYDSDSDNDSILTSKEPANDIIVKYQKMIVNTKNGAVESGSDEEDGEGDGEGEGDGNSDGNSDENSGENSEEISSEPENDRDPRVIAYRHHFMEHLNSTLTPDEVRNLIGPFVFGSEGDNGIDGVDEIEAENSYGSDQGEEDNLNENSESD